MARILVADDERGICSFIAEALEMDGHNVTTVADGLAAIQALKQGPFEVMITDVRMPGADGITTFRSALKIQPGLQVIILTAHGSVEMAVEAMKLGALDFLQKPISGPAELRVLVARAVRAHGNKNAPEAAPTGATTLTWGAPAMEPVARRLEKVAPTNATVLLLGESGSGKEVAARALHEQSARKDGPFVAINCASLTGELLGSELFGHEKGAFTGAVDRKRGRIEMAEGGTFFLDEVGELQLDLQGKLLRVLEERRFSRIGGTQVMDANVRWVAATNRDLRAMMQSGAFREDLYHRLAVFPVAVPPLRDRREDIPPLAQLLLERIAREHGRAPPALAKDALAALQSASWRGNVRELRNVLERAVILADGDVLHTEHLCLFEEEGHGVLASSGSTQVSPDGVTLAELERQAILTALKAVGGHRQKAAERLGIGLRTLYDKLKRYEIA